MSVYKRDTETGRILKKGETPKGKARWYCSITVRSKRYGPISLADATNKKQAEQAEAKLKTEIFEGKYGNRARVFSFEKFVSDVYLDWAKEHKRVWKQDLYYSRYLCEHFRGLSLADVTPDKIRKYQQQRRNGITTHGKTRNPNTVNREIATLSKIFSLAVDMEYCDANPCKKVKRFKVNCRKDRVITREEEHTLRAALKERKHRIEPVVILAFNTGMRRGELFNLEWQNVDFKAGFIRLLKGTTKNGKGRDLPMTREARELLTSLRPSEDAKGLVFPFDRNMAGQEFAELCRELKLDGVTLHTIRHTFATRLAEAGVHPFTAQELMGHLRIDMTQYYTHTQNEEVMPQLRARALLSCSLNLLVEIEFHSV